MTGGRPAPAKSHHPSEDAVETAILTIDLDALIANYRRLRELAGAAECAAVVKADAYGLGMAEAAPALRREGCKTFFVATPGEAKALRKLLPDAIIYVLAGLMPGTAGEFRKHDLRPVLNSTAEIREWAALSASVGEALPCAVHIDSGMNRLGLSAAEVETASGRARSLVGLDALPGDEPPRLRRRARAPEERGAAQDLRPAPRASAQGDREPRQLGRHPARPRLCLRSGAARHRALRRQASAPRQA